MKLSHRVLEFDESATLAITAKAAELKAQGTDVISFSVGEPDFDTPPTVSQAAWKAIRAGRTRYPMPASGLLEAKEAVRGKLRRDNGLEYGTRQIQITTGCKMGCYLALQALVDPGDEVLIPVPYWVSYPDMVRLAGGTPIVIPTEGDIGMSISPERLGSMITPRTRVLILNSPNNPGGFVYPAELLREFGRLACKHDLVILSDETYDALVYGDCRHVSIASLNPDIYERTVTLNSASKTYAMTGWRIGYAAGPEPIIKAMAKLDSQMTSGVATFIQIALAHALSGDQASVEPMRRAFEERGHLMARRLNSFSGFECLRPMGAFYCFPNVSEAMERLRIRGSVEFAERLLNEAHVAVVPGEAFGSDTHLRFSYAVGIQTINTGLDRLEAWMQGVSRSTP